MSLVYSLIQCNNFEELDGFITECLYFNNTFTPTCLKKKWELYQFNRYHFRFRIQCHDVTEEQASMLAIIRDFIDELDLSFSSIENVSDFSCVNTIVLNYCDKITDVSYLKNEHISLRGCKNLVAIPPKARSLDLSYTNNIDLSNITDVYEINLSYTNIKHLQPLERVTIVNLSYCEYVKDVFALANCNKVILLGCKNVTRVSCLGGVQTLDLSETGVVDVSALGGVQTLDLSETGVVDVSALAYVPYLTLFKCQKLMRCIMHNKYLNVAHTNLVIDDEMIKDVEVLHYSDHFRRIRCISKNDFKNFNF